MNSRHSTKKNFKICIRMTIDTDTLGLPDNLDAKLQSVENIITDTEQFYDWTTQYIENILTYVPPPPMTKPSPVQVLPEIENIGNTMMAQTIQVIPDIGWNSAIEYKGVTKDVDETS
jgi:hypothetical protein